MYEQSAEIDQIAAAMAAFQGEVNNPKRTKTVRVTSRRTGQTYTFQYAPLDVILDTVRPVLGKNGLSVSQHPQKTPTGVVVITQVTHSSGQWYRSDFELNGEGDTKDFGSLCTYARRYALEPILGVCGEVDDDASMATGDKVSVEPKPGEISQRVDFTTRPAPTNPYVPEEQVQEFREWMLRKLSTKESRQAAATILRSNGVDFNRSMSVTPAALERVRRELVALIENAEQGDQP